MFDFMRRGSLLSQAAPPDGSLMLAGRIALLASALCSIGAYTFLSSGQHALILARLYLPIAGLFGFTALSAIWLKARGGSLLFFASQVFVDALMATGVVYATGSSISPFLFLYLPIAASASVFISRRAGFFTAGFCAALYGELLILIQTGTLPAADGSTALFQPPGGLALQVAALGVALLLTAFGSGILMRKLRSSYQLVEHSRAESRDREKALIESMPAALVTALLDDTIQNINAAARDILGAVGAAPVGRKMPEVLKDLDPECVLPDAKKGTHSVEINLGQGDDKKRVRVVCRQTQIPGERQPRLGKVYIFEDITALRSIEEQLELQEKMARLLMSEPERAQHQELGTLVGESPVIRKVFALIRRVAVSDATILITGESGTGKELAAKAIHQASPRASGPFVAVNCGAIPETLIESELFGHVRGAFTGAASDHNGLFRQANGGTLFLDEVGELSPAMQAKILRALQEKSIRPVGAEKTASVDVRVLAATNRSLRDEVVTGSFREDLFYRLNVINLVLPPLRDRKTDIPLLVNFFLRKSSRGGPLPFVSPEAMRRLAAYDYPGNVRELENIIERACVLGGDVILPEHLPENVTDAESAGDAPRRAETRIIVDETIEFPVSLDEVLACVERRYLEVALVKTNGAKKKAADLLGINFRSFRYRLQKFGLGEEAE